MAKNKKNNKNYSSVIPIMENLFKGYKQYPLNTMKPLIIYDDMIYMINFMIINDNHKFDKLLHTDEILNVEVLFSNTEDKKLGVTMVFNKQFRFECHIDANNKAERRTVYEAFELSKQLVVWNLDVYKELIRVQKIKFNFTEHLNVFNKYILQV